MSSDRHFSKYDLLQLRPNLKFRVSLLKLNFDCLKSVTYHVILPTKNPVVDVQPAKLLLVDAHQVISLKIETKKKC